MNNLDPETIEGDYREAYQRWEHIFNKSAEEANECFKDCAYVPCKLFYDPETETPGWNNYSERIKNLLKRCKNKKERTK